MTVEEWQGTEDKPRECTKCRSMVQDWSLAPIGTNEDNTQRIYQEDTYLCDGCYEHWCTKWNTQPLEGE
jgi:hypothetical protein